MNLYPSQQALDALAQFPNLVHRPLWAAAPLPPRKSSKTGPSGAPPENRAQSASTGTPMPTEASVGSEWLPMEDTINSEFPADTPLELVGAYLAFLKAANRRGWSVVGTRLRPVELTLWLAAGEERAEVAFYYGPRGSALLARVVHASGEEVAATAFTLLQALVRPPVPAQAARTALAEWAARQPVTYVSEIEQASTLTLRELCAWVARSQSMSVNAGGTGEEELQGTIYGGYVLPGRGYWLVDCAYAPGMPFAEYSQALTGLSVLFLRKETGACADAAFLDQLMADPFLADLLLAGFCGRDSRWVTLLVRLWPGEANYAPGRAVLQRYLRQYHGDIGSPADQQEPLACPALFEGGARGTWRPFMLWHCAEYRVRPGLE